MSFEIIHKPTFTNQLLAIPKEFVAQILEKIELLRDDPSPRGSVKKKLHGYQGKIYRLRSGVYRIIYTYEKGWVALLGVDARKDVYKGSKLVAGTTELDVSQLPTVEQLLTPQPKPSVPIPPPQPEHLLPTQLDEILLKQLQIPRAYFAPLLACRTLNDLVSANIPESIRDRVFDCVTTPNFDQVIQQPSFVTPPNNDLLRFKAGDLLGFLLKLNPEQEKYVTWALSASGPTLLKGSPGTGKSTVALYRAREMLSQLRASGQGQPKLLFTTYTNALVTFSEQLLKQLLGSDYRRVDVKTADSLMYSLICSHTGKPSIASSSQLKRTLKQALPAAIATLDGNPLQQKAQQMLLQRLTVPYLIDEISDVIEARGLQTLADYQSTPRTGRLVPLNKTQRQAIWHLRSHFYQKLADSGLETWPQLRNRALNILSQQEQTSRYDAVIIDEAQDLPPNTLRFLTQLCHEPNRLFITADANQSIYGSSFRWSDIHEDLKFVGRTGILRVNHRTTQEIDQAAHHYLQGAQLTDTGDDANALQYIHSGPAPAVRAVADGETEAALLAQFCQSAAREYRLGLGACAILTPSEKAGKAIAAQLSARGLVANFMSSKVLDLNRRGVKVLTLKSAKGLEFPIVAIAGFLDASFPYMPKDTPPEAQAEILAQERRTLFVAMTRAMRALLLIVPSQAPGPLLQGFDASYWNLGNTGS